MKDKFRVKSIALGRVKDIVSKEYIAVTFEDNAVQMYKAISVKKTLETNTVFIPKLKEVRCDGTTKKGIPCTRLLGKIDGSYEIKCPECGKIHTFDTDKNK